MACTACSPTLIVSLGICQASVKALWAKPLLKDLCLLHEHTEMASEA